MGKLLHARDANRDEARDLLRRAVGDPAAEFRDGQWEAIDLLVNRRGRALVVQRTGWGKSSVYFVATRLLRDRGQGPTLIVSPLLALMRNQIDAAVRLGLHAITINSTNSADWPVLIRSIHSDDVDALLISPERLANESFVDQVLLPTMNRVGLLVIDEVHCISDWGHDFRPDYRRLANVLNRMPPNVPILGTTATANKRVVEDVATQLGGMQVQRGPLTRKSIRLQTLRLDDQAARLAWLADHISEMPGTGIVYTLTKHDADRVSAWLNMNSVDSRAYYSGIEAPGFDDSNLYRQHLEDLLLGNRIKALVATTALGMGYDKPDLGFVVHYQAPGSIVTYYQQVGRAGRSIESAFGVLLSGREDGEIQDYFRNTAFPDERHVAAILDALAASDGLTERELEGYVNLRAGLIQHALKFLSVDNPAPVIRDGNRWRRTAVPYQLDRELIARLTGRRAVEWQEIQDYIDSRECLMTFLARALDDGTTERCGRCTVCVGHPPIPAEFSRVRAADAARFLREAEVPLICKVQVASGAFTEYGFRGTLPELLRAQTGRILSRWRDAGWGHQVAEDKHAGHFGDELVGALVDMIQRRWRPDPPPEWVTCIPSLRDPNLVPDFAQRVAARLGLPFIAAIVKVRANEPQKVQENRFHQNSNLDGAFAIRQRLPSGPVLLVDDVVDSSWTMTVSSALLLQAGASVVWPVALASAATGE